MIVSSRFLGYYQINNALSTKTALISNRISSKVVYTKLIMQIIVCFAFNVGIINETRVGRSPAYNN